jgi:cytochrome c oxidase assembly factor CtaG
VSFLSPLFAAAGPVSEAPSWLTSWTFDPWQLVPTLVFVVLYGRRVWTLEQEGRPVPLWRIWLFALGIVIAVLAFTSPLHAIGESSSMAVHMSQHLILGDIVPLLILFGLTRPLLRPLLALPVIGELRFLVHPGVALPLWALNLGLWHMSGAYDAALSNDAVHALQHILFLTTGALMWAALIETLPGPVWFGTGAKIGYLVVVRGFDTVLGNVFTWSSHGFYRHYDNVPRLWGLSQAADQSYAGVVMMSESGIVTLVMLAVLVYRAASESDQRQLLIERGLDPERVKRAVRFGRARELALRELGYVPSRFQSEAPEVARPAR